MRNKTTSFVWHPKDEFANDFSVICVTGTSGSLRTARAVVGLVCYEHLVSGNSDLRPCSHPEAGRISSRISPVYPHMHHGQTWFLISVCSLEKQTAAGISCVLLSVFTEQNVHLYKTLTSSLPSLHSLLLFSFSLSQNSQFSAPPKHTPPHPQPPQPHTSVIIKPSAGRSEAKHGKTAGKWKTEFTLLLWAADPHTHATNVCSAHSS